MENRKIIFRIKDLNHAIVRYSYENGVKRETLPTPAQMQIIHYICSKKGSKVYQRDIGLALNLRRATLSEILKTMERNQLISRIPDKTDTRIKEIILSENTKEKFNAVKQNLDKTEKTLLKDIDQKDLETFLKVISKMQENLKNERMDIC